MWSGDTVVIKCLHRFDRLQSILYSWWGSRAVACLFAIAVLSPGDLVMVNILLLYFENIRSTKPDFNVYLKFMCGLAALFSELLMLCDSIY